MPADHEYEPLQLRDPSDDGANDELADFEYKSRSPVMGTGRRGGGGGGMSAATEDVRQWVNKVHSQVVNRNPSFLAVVAVLALVLAFLPFLFRLGPPRDLPDQCEACGPHDELCDKWGERAIRRSRAYDGTLLPMKEFARKVRRGQPINIGVIGGSISACIDSTPEACYPSVLIDRLRHTLKRYSPGPITMHNVALPGLGSSFFGRCWHQLFPADVPLDLIIVEAAVNDVNAWVHNVPMEILVRSLLKTNPRPALIFLTMFSPLFMWENAAPGIESIAQYYDSPVISHRNIVHEYRHKHEHDQSGIFEIFHRGGNGEWPNFAGGHHPSPRGHELTADILASFITETVCKTRPRDHEPVAPKYFDLEIVRTPEEMPEWSVFDWMDVPPTTMKTEFQCFTAGSQRAGLPLIDSKTSGFDLGHWKSKEFLVGYQVGDRAVFELNLTDSHIQMMYWRAQFLGFGMVRVWFDGEEEAGVNVDGWWDWTVNIPVEMTLETSGALGRRELNVEIVNVDRPANEFRILAVIA